MQAFSVVSYELVALTATLVLLLLSYRYETTAGHAKLFHLMFGILVLICIGQFFNFGSFRGEGRLVHEHEQYHFFLGSKYLKEVRYDAIYDAGVLAAVETGIFKSSAVFRLDPMTFNGRSHPIAPVRAAEVHGRFTPERWDQFRADVEWFGDTRRYLADHGNTGSPAWAMMAGLFTSHVAINRTSARLLATLDLILLLLLFVTVWRTFGERTLSLTLIVGLSVPVLYLYLGGSILRMDWIVALGLSVCLFEKRHFRAAGILLGYAVSVKLLAGIMVLPFGLRFLVEALRRRSVDRDHLRYISYAWIGLALFVLASTVYFADPQLWREYYQRLLVTYHQHFYFGQHSFRDLFLQAYRDPGSIWSPFPARVMASHHQAPIESLRGLFATAQVLLLAGLVFVAAPQPFRYSFALGPLAVFVLLVSNRYYWQFWMIAAIALAPTYRKEWRHLGYLCLIVVWLGVGQIPVLSRSFDTWRGYLGSYGLFWIGAALVGFELVSWWRNRRAAAR